MAKKIQVDFGLCESNGVCMGIAPDIFYLDDDDYLHLLDEAVTPDNEADVLDSIRQCPRQAISLTDT